LLLLDV
jgi:hypothetical protein